MQPLTTKIRSCMKFITFHFLIMNIVKLKNIVLLILMKEVVMISHNVHFFMFLPPLFN
jgi:hypothetical protein